jgi:PAS domain S-box-containing protein
MSALLALAFAKIDAAVVLVDDDGRIIIANPAMAALTGFTIEALDGKPVHELTHPKEVARASAAHARQLANGERYQMPLVILAKNGTAISLRLTSELIENAILGRVRIATFVPEPVAATTSGRVITVSLQAARVAYGEAWERMSGRLGIMAESVIKQRLGPHDVFARSGDTDFTVWFATADEMETSACIATITRELRIRLLGLLGESVTAKATHVILEPLAPPLPRPEARPQDQQDIGHPRALDVIAQLSSDPQVEITRVTHGDDQPAGLIWADLPHAARLRLDMAVASLPEDALLGAGLAAYPELLRLRFAVAGIKRDVAEGQRQGWLLPISCTALLSRKRRRQLLDALRDTPAPVRARLRALLTDVPPGSLATILRDWFEPSAPLLQTIGVLSRAPSLPQDSSLRTPIKLVAIDLDPGPAPPTDAIVKLLGTARKLGLPVMVRTTRRDQVRIWRDHGATLFAITKLITQENPM